MVNSFRALEDISDAVGVADLDGRAIYHNNAFLERFGFKPEELNAQGGLPWIFKDDAITAQILDRVQSGGSWNGEIELRTKDGIVLPTLLRTDCVFDAEGDPVGMMAVCTDITDRKLAEILLKESEDRYRAVVEDQTELIFRFTPHERLTFLNRAFSEYFRGSPASLMQRKLSRFIPKQRIRHVRALLGSLIPQDPYMSFELASEGPSGATHWHQWTVRALFDGDGAPIEYQAVGRDITAHKVAAEALRASEVQHRFVADHASDMITRQDPSGTYLFVSRAAERLFGYNFQDLLGRSAFDFIHPDDIPHVRSEYDSVLDAKTLATCEFRFRRKDGTYVWVEGTIRSVKNSDGQIVALMAAVRDVSARKRQEAKRAHRLRVEDALLKVSRLLISSRDIAFNEVLKTIGKAVDAQHVFLYLLPPNERSKGLVGSWKAPHARDRGHYIRDILSKDEAWLRSRLKKGFVVATQLKFTTNGSGHDGSDNRDERPTALLVPILSDGNEMMGYIEFDTKYPNYIWPTEDIRILCVLGDMLASYLERNKYERALQESEEKYRTFVATISEAIWCFELTKPLDVAVDLHRQVATILEGAVLSECNAVFSQVMAGATPQDTIGCTFKRLFDSTAENIVNDFVLDGYRIENEDFAVIDHAGRERHFIFNIVGIVENNQLKGAWGSQTDITGQVELKRSMVSALEDQQQRIGHDLHDGVGPYLTGIRMLSEKLAEHLEAFDDRHRNQAQKIVSLAQDAALQVRKIYRGLTPLQIYHEGLAMALQDMASDINDLPDVTCVFSREGDLDIYDNKKKVNLYRITQEAVNNALKHGKPTNIWISFSSEDNTCQVTVRDDGTGFDPTKLPGNTLGVTGMYFRAKMINAELKIDSKIEAGTVVKCTLTGDAE